MTVATTTPYDSELGNAVKTAFDFAFKIFAETDLVVWKETAAGVYTQQTIVPDWGVDPDPLPAANTCWVEFDTDAETGTVHYDTAVGDGLRSYIARASTAAQASALPTDDPMKNKTVEIMVDKLTLMVQELKAQLARTALSAETTVPPANIVLGAPVNEMAVYWTLGGDGKWYLNASTVSIEDLEAALALASSSAIAAAASAAEAAASAAATVSETSGPIANRPAAPANAAQYWATDMEQLFKYSPAAGRWFLIG